MKPGNVAEVKRWMMKNLKTSVIYEKKVFKQKKLQPIH
jgi:hypothetical protein